MSAAGMKGLQIQHGARLACKTTCPCRVPARDRAAASRQLWLGCWGRAGQVGWGTRFRCAQCKCRMQANDAGWHVLQADAPAPCIHCMAADVTKLDEAGAQSYDCRHPSSHTRQGRQSYTCAAVSSR